MGAMGCMVLPLLYRAFSLVQLATH